MPDFVLDSGELMRGALETGLPPVRAMLEQTRELDVVTEAPDYRQTPTELIDELLAELTTDKLVALVRQTERPIDEAVKAALARIRGELSSANVPKDVLANFDDFVAVFTEFAQILQEREVARGLRRSDEDESQDDGAHESGAYVTIGEMLLDAWKDPTARIGLVLAALVTAVVVGGFQARFWFWLLVGLLVCVWGVSFIAKRRKRRRPQEQRGEHPPGRRRRKPRRR